MFSMNMFKNTSLTYVVFAIGLVAVASFSGIPSEIKSSTVRQKTTTNS